MTTLTRVMILLLGIFLVADFRTVSATSQTSDNLSGKWKFTIFNNTYTVVLKRDMSGRYKEGDRPDYCGVGQAETKQKDGKEITAEICATMTKEGELGALVDGDGIACKAPFKSDGAMVGSCVINVIRRWGQFGARREPPPEK